VASVTAPEGTARVAVVAAADDPLAALIAAEFEFLGFSSEWITAPGPQDPLQLDQLAREHDVAAAVLVRSDGGFVQVWISDRVTGKVVIRRVAVDRADDPRVVAVHAVELLRASLLELERNPAPTGHEVAASAPVRRALRATPTRFGLSLSGAVMGAPGGLGPLAGLRGSFRHMPHPHVGWVVTATAPVSAARVREAEGEAEVRVGWLVTGVRVALLSDERVLRPDLQATVGLLGLSMVGHARAPYVDGRDLVLTGVGELAAGLELAATARLRVRLAAAAGACFTRPEIRFAGRPVGSWCLPYGAGELGVGVVW